MNRIILTAALTMSLAGALICSAAELEKSSLAVPSLEVAAPPSDIDVARILEDARHAFLATEQHFDQQMDQLVHSKEWPPKTLKQLKAEAIADIDAALVKASAGINLSANSSKKPVDNPFLTSLQKDRLECLQHINSMADTAVSRLAYVSGVFH